MALITKWQLTIIIRTCFIVYRALPDFLLSHLNTFPFLLIPWGFTNTASHRGRVHASTRMYTHIRTHVHRSSLCVGSAWALRCSHSVLGWTRDQSIDEVIGGVSIDPQSWAGNSWHHGPPWGETTVLLSHWIHVFGILKFRERTGSSSSWIIGSFLSMSEAWTRARPWWITLSIVSSSRRNLEFEKDLSTSKRAAFHL